MHNKNKNHGRYANKSQVLFSFKKVNWYWDIRLWSPLYVLLLVLILSNPTTEEIPTEAEIVQVEATTESTENTEPTISQEEQDIVALARLADSVASGRPIEVKEIIMWVVINRVEDRSHGYGGSLQEEISRPKQWQQYDPNSYYMEDTYELAERVYDRWKRGGARIIPGDMLWFVLNGNGSITIRNQFKEGKNRAEMTFGE